MNSPHLIDPASRQRGFTVLELLLVMVIAGMIMAVAVPSSMRFYESIQYRQAVRDVITALASARYDAVNSGQPRDVAIDPGHNTLELNGRRTQLPEQLQVAVHAARELNRDSQGVIRFYPEGGSSGGGVDIQRRDGSGVRVSVDWLVGSVSQEAYVAD